MAGGRPEEVGAMRKGKPARSAYVQHDSSVRSTVPILYAHVVASVQLRDSHAKERAVAKGILYVQLPNDGIIGDPPPLTSDRVIILLVTFLSGYADPSSRAARRSGSDREPSMQTMMRTAVY